MNNVDEACKRFDDLGVEFVKRPDAGKMKGLAFIKVRHSRWSYCGLLHLLSAAAYITQLLAPAGFQQLQMAHAFSCPAAAQAKQAIIICPTQYCQATETFPLFCVGPRWLLVGVRCAS